MIVSVSEIVIVVLWILQKVQYKSLEIKFGITTN